MSAVEASIDLDRVERQRRLKAKQKQLVYATRSLIETFEVCQPSIEAWIRFLLGLDEFDADYERMLERLKQVKVDKEKKQGCALRSTTINPITCTYENMLVSIHMQNSSVTIALQFN